jgi:hypothetical protein
MDSNMKDNQPNTHIERNTKLIINTLEKKIKEIESFDLLDNILTPKKLTKLTDNQLKDLYLLAIKTPEINCIRDKNHKLHMLNIDDILTNGTQNLSRKQMLRDIHFILTDRKLQNKESPNISLIKDSLCQIILSMAESLEDQFKTDATSEDQEKYKDSFNSIKLLTNEIKGISVIYSNLAKEPKINVEAKRKEFLKVLTEQIENECRHYTSKEVLDKQPKLDVVKYYTNHSKKELEALAKQAVVNMPDFYFSASWKKQMEMQISIAKDIVDYAAATPPKTKITPSKSEGIFNTIRKNLKTIISQIKEVALTGIKTPPSTQNSKEITLEDLKKYEFSAGNDLEYVGMWKEYLNRIISKGQLLKLENPSRDQIPYIEEYIEAKRTLNRIAGELSSSDAVKINELADKVKDSVAVKALDRLEKQEIKRLESKEGKKLLPTGLTAKDEQALKWLEDALNDKPLSENKKDFLQKYIDSSLGNMQLNKVLGVLIEKRNLNGINEATVKKLHYFTFKTKYVDEFLIAAKKLKKNCKRINNNNELSDNHKITLREYGIINNFTNIQYTLEKMNNLGLLDNNPKLLNLLKAATQAEKDIEQVNNIIKSEQNLESGDLVFYDGKKHNEYFLIKPSLRSKITDHFITNTHAAKIAKEEAESIRKFDLSHVMYEGHSKDELITSQILFSSIYKVHIDRLIPKEMQLKLKEYYDKEGKNWKEEVNKLYREIEGQLHKDTKDQYSKVTYNSNRKGIILSEILPKGHKKSKDQDFSKAYNKILDGYYNEKEKKMICSEFAARTTVAAIAGIDMKLKDVLGITDKNTHVVEMPFDKKEKLSKVHPDRLVKILQEKGCIEKQQPTPTQKNIFRS